MFKLVAAVSTTALLAGLAVTAVSGLSSKVEAHMLPAKGDRLDLKTYGAACSTRAWPHFETTCLRDTTSSTRGARPVRFITIDRLADVPGAAKVR